MVKAAMIHHMNVAIDDVDEARDFYGRILGLPELVRPDVGRPGLWFGVGSNELHLSVQPDVEGGRTSLSLHPNERPDRPWPRAAPTPPRGRDAVALVRIFRDVRTADPHAAQPRPLGGDRWESGAWRPR